MEFDEHRSPTLATSAPSTWDARHGLMKDTLCERCEHLDLARIITDALFKNPTRYPVVGIRGAAGRILLEIDINSEHETPKCSLCRILWQSPQLDFLMRTTRHQHRNPGTLCLVLVVSCARRPWYKHTLAVLPKQNIEDNTLYPSVSINFPGNEVQNEHVSTRCLMPKANLSLLHDWVHFCGVKHKQCNPATKLEEEQSFEIFLLDCRSRTILSGSLKSRFATLSYVW